MMKRMAFIKNGLILCMALILLPMAGWAEEKLPGPDGYSFYTTKYKKQFDDPTDLFVARPLKSILPPEIDEIMTFDKEKIKKETAELLSFSAPEVVGKIAPEIKPGKYTYSKRIYYIDMETFACIYNEDYDQKGRLYRTQYYHGYSFFPEYGGVNH
jgi:hypothetical protein